MAQSYIFWALVGMAGYSFMTLFTKLAERQGSASTWMVLAVSTTIVAIFAIAVVIWRGEGRAILAEMEQPALTLAVSSLFHALSLGPSNVVVPIYGMFIVGGALLGVVFLEEPMSWNKIVGLIAAVAGVVLISV